MPTTAKSSEGKLLLDEHVPKYKVTTDARSEQTPVKSKVAARQAVTHGMIYEGHSTCEICSGRTDLAADTLGRLNLLQLERPVVSGKGSPTLPEPVYAAAQQISKLPRSRTVARKDTDRNILVIFPVPA